jgi:hypothetical protein
MPLKVASTAYILIPELDPFQNGGLRTSKVGTEFATTWDHEILYDDGY